ncbi:MAG: hypothetical protein QOG53_37 [Frankiales bacterium]|jgi:hypothetical protein|nr:hypothetical protein [Frankiales bacterium]
MPAVLVLLAAVLFHLQNPQIDEASGIARGLRSGDVYYVHNDSGDRARFFALDRRTGATRAVYAVPGARNVDWEDIAVARDARGIASVWIADIGDNRLRRTEVTIYRVDEPNVPHGRKSTEHTTARPEVWRLRYPDGRHDAEALLVDPLTHRAFIVTKSLTGTSTVYAVPATSKAGSLQQLTTVATLVVPGIISGPRQLAITGGAISQDGGRLVLRTYTDAYEWALRRGNVVAALAARPKLIALPDQPQGEGITIDGAKAVIVSEGTRTPVYSVSLPPVPPATPVPHPVLTIPAPGDDSSRPWTVLIAGLVALIVLVGVTARVWVRRASARRR